MGRGGGVVEEFVKRTGWGDDGGGGGGRVTRSTQAEGSGYTSPGKYKHGH